MSTNVYSSLKQVRNLAQDIKEEDWEKAYALFNKCRIIQNMIGGIHADKRIFTLCAIFDKIIWKENIKIDNKEVREYLKNNTTKSQFDNLMDLFFTTIESIMSDIEEYSKKEESK